MHGTDTQVRVLHVDDDPDLVDLAATFVERVEEQFDVTTATSVAEAQELRAEHGFDCIVSDYEMPETDGLEFLEQVRAESPDLPFVLYTGKGSEEVASEAISLGVSDYLQKEQGTDQYTLLANRIGNLVDGYRAETELTRHHQREREAQHYHHDLLAITADPTASTEERIERILTLTREFFGTDNGHLVRIDEASGHHHVVSVSGSDIVRTGVTDLSETFCRRTIETDAAFEVYDAPGQGWADDPAYERWGIGCYIGKKLVVEGELYGTVCFASEAPRPEPFTQNQKTFFDLVAMTVNQLLERQRRRTEFETVLEGAHEAVFIVDVSPSLEFTLRRTNAVYESLADGSPESLVGGRPLDLRGDTAADDVESHYRDCIRQRSPVEYETSLGVGGGSTRWSIRLTPVVENDEVVQLVGTAERLAAPRAVEEA